MHGRVKVRTTAEQQELKRKEREKKVRLYKDGIDHVFSKRDRGELDIEILESTAQLLIANPDIYTLWNIRRDTFLHFKEKEEDFESLMKGDLVLTERCLKANPKSYCTWHHRVWILEHMSQPNWKHELNLCNKYLELDERNFHVWNYRRFIVSKSNVSNEEEFLFSTSLILKNFSNYSSWHYRSKLLPLTHPDPNNVRPICQLKHQEELKLVENASFTDPNDQSAWFYLHWLLGRGKQPLKIVQAVVSRTLVLVSLSHCVGLHDGKTKLEIRVNNVNVPGKWQSTNGKLYCHVWHFSSSVNIWQNNILNGAINIHLFDDCKEVHILCLQEVISGSFFGLSHPQFEAQFSEGLTTVLQEQLDSCCQLLKLEPESKWTLLTSVLLMQAIDRNKYKDETMKKLGELLNVDILRTGYYKDLRSRYVMEYAIDSLVKSLEENKSVTELDLSDNQLTALYHCQYLSVLSKINFTSNFLGRSLQKLHHLQSCKVLILDDCKITSFEGMPSLICLQELSVKNNDITTVDSLCNLRACPNIEIFDLRGNPLEKEQELFPSVIKTLPTIKKLNGKDISTL